MARGSPYLRCLDRVEGAWVWQVNGHWVRDQLDVEFTNGHHHFTRRYVPRDEIWIDREAEGAREWPFWALRQRVERALMASGVPYLRALQVAARTERLERRLALARRAGGDPAARPRVAELARRRRLGTVAGREVWLVAGRIVRDLAYVDFTLGGHGHRYRFISRREIWIDDAVRPAERAAILHHEAVEVALMAAGMKYAAAHARASREEVRFRRGLPGRGRATVLANVGS